MFTNLAQFPQEKDVHASKLAEIEQKTGLEANTKDRLLREEEDRYKGQVRKYLPTALNVINNNFNCQYSIYKVGKDYDANFNVIETNVKKTKAEIINDMNDFKAQALGRELTADQINQINLAMDVLLTYTADDAAYEDETKESFLKNAKVTATSIMEPSDKFTSTYAVATEKVPDAATFNPYANQPVELTNQEFNKPAESKVITNPFGELYGTTGMEQQSLSSLSNPTSTSPNLLTQQPLNSNNDEKKFGFMNNQSTQETTNKFNSDAYLPGNNQGLNQVPLSGNAQPIIQDDVFSMFSNALTPKETVAMDIPENNTPITYSGTTMTNYGIQSTSSPMQTNYNQQPQQGTSQQPTISPMIPLPSRENADGSSNRFVQSNLLGDEMDPNDDQQFARPLADDEKQHPIRRLLVGFPIMPILAGIVLAIYWGAMTGIEKLGFMDDIVTNVGAENMVYIELIFIGIVELILANTACNIFKSRQTTKSAMLSLCLYSVFVYASPNILDFVMNNFKFDFMESLEFLVYFALYVFIAFSFGFMVFFSSLFKNADDGRKLKWNFAEKLGFFWLVYTLYIPVLIYITPFINTDKLVKKIEFLYNYDNANVIIMVVSGVFAVLMTVLNFIESKKNR